MGHDPLSSARRWDRERRPETRVSADGLGPAQVALQVSRLLQHDNTSINLLGLCQGLEQSALGERRHVDGHDGEIVLTGMSGGTTS